MSNNGPKLLFSLVIILLCGFSNSAYATEQKSIYAKSFGFVFQRMLPKILENVVASDCSRTLFTQMDKRYLHLSQRKKSLQIQLQNVRDCNHAAKVLTDTIDCHFPISKNPFAPNQPTCFVGELQSMLALPQEIEFLDSFSLLMQEVKIRSDLSFNLWNEVLKLSQNDSRLALKRLAVLFQYNLLSYKTNGQYLNIGAEDLAIFKKANRIFPGIRIPNNLDLYPSFFKSKEASSYHFYTIAYLALKIADKIENRQVAMLIPYILNYRYEKNVTSINNRRPDKFILSLFRRPIDEDTYLGYLGILWANEGLAEPENYWSRENYFEFFGSDHKNVFESL